jgi:REP element-mobilizing transposase RayT
MPSLLDYKRFLPHKQETGAVIMISWRQNMTIPQAILDLMQELETAWDQTHLPNESRSALHKQKYFAFDAELPKYNHPDFSLTAPPYAAIIKNALHYYEKRLYRLLAYCLMSNHIHIMIQPIPNAQAITPLIPDIVSRIKSYTAKKINEQRGTKGSVWAHDFYDTMMRNDEHLWHALSYILNNPVKAGIVDNWQDYPHGFWNRTLFEP